MPIGKLMYVCPKCNKPAKLAFHKMQGRANESAAAAMNRLSGP